MRCTLQMKMGFVRPVRNGAAEPQRIRFYESGPIRYVEAPPPKDLAPDLVCFWNLRVDPSSPIHLQHVLPDLTVDVISRNGGPLLLLGPPTGAIRIPLRPGTVLEGARIRAGAARRLLHASPADLLNAIVPLDDVLRAPLRQTAAAPDPHVDSIVSGLLRRSIVEHDLKLESTVRSAITWLGTNWRGSVEDMSRHFNRSNRDLRRRFMAVVGMGPKLVQRMVRVQHALHVMSARTGNVSLSDLAFECGFADQAHMTREVARFTDHTPSGLRHLAHSTETVRAD